MRKLLVFVSFITFIVIATLLVDFGSGDTAKGEEEQLHHLLDQTMEEYEVKGYSVNKTDSVLYFHLADTEDKTKFQQAIQKKLEKHNINQYELSIDNESDIQRKFGIDT